MKKLLFTIAAATLLASCSQEEGLDGGASKSSGVTVAIQGYQLEGGISSRTSVSFDMAGNPPFTYKWTEGDRIGLFPEGDGMQQIYLKMAGEMGERMQFTGEGFSVNGGTNYAIYYPFIYDYDLESSNIPLDYSTQTQEGNGSCTHLTAHDYMAAVATASSDHNVDFNLTHVGTILVITGELPEADTYTAIDLTAPEEDFATTATLSLFPQPVVTPAQKTSTISLNLQNVSTTEDDRTFTAFMQICPADLTDKTITITLHSATSGKDLVYTHTPTKAWEGNKAYLIELKNDEVDHSKNPLHKWAETNLVRKTGTTGANAQNEFASSYTEIGSYYQFGRNHGYSSYTDVTNYAIESTNIPSNRNVYTGKPSTTTVSKYSVSTTILSNYPQYFFIDPNHDGDYAVVNGATKSQTWSERATYNGYATGDPSPEGWRLPTLKDYKEIMPQGSFSGLLTSLSEVKSLEDGTHYAIQWNRVTTNNENYLQIRCLVVPSSVADASTIDWENEENVVVRYFRAGGAIQASYHWWQFTYNGYSSNQYIACPLPLCAYDAKVQQLTMNTATVVYTITRNDNNLCGLYWMSDAGQYAMTFRYDPNNYQQGSCVDIFGNTLPNAYNIRCVKAE